MHGYEFSNLRRMKPIKGINFNMLSVKSIRIMNRFAHKIKVYSELYVKKLEASPNFELISQKKVNMIFAVLLALFNDHIEARASQSEKAPAQVLSTEHFYDKLMKLKVRRSVVALPNLTSFLAYKNETNYIDVKRLATATGEFLRNQYLQSFGTSKKIKLPSKSGADNSQSLAVKNAGKDPTGSEKQQ